MKLGLKLWSKNDCYLKSAAKLYHKGYYDFIELYAVPGSVSKYLKFWKRLKIPYIIHAPHYAHGFNLADIAKRERNRKLFKEAQSFADELRAEHIVVHCGVLGSRKEAEKQLSMLKDIRIAIENKPLFGLDDSICVGSSPQEIKCYKKAAKAGFCFDVNHAIGYAFASGKNYIKVINDFLRLNPVMMHMAGIIRTSNGDEHLHLKQSDCDLGEIMKAIIDNGKSIEFCTLETPKEPENGLKDFKEDLRILKNLINKKDSLILRSATWNDCKDLWLWRNRIEVRQNCFDDKPVAWKTHKKWFDSRLKNNNVRIYIGQCGADRVGAIRFEIDEKFVAVSVNTNPDFFNKGFGTAMIKLGTKKAFFELGKSRPILADIKKENTVSQKAFKKAGYKYRGCGRRGIVYAAKDPDK